MKKEEQVIDTDGQVLTKITYDDGHIIYKNTKGQRHRIGGPAVIFPNGQQEYNTNDKRHRIDGPAIIWADGTHSYFINDSRYTKRQYLKEVKLLQIEVTSRVNLKKEQVIDTDGQVLTKTTYPKGSVKYRNTKGKLHRIGGPAVIGLKGHQEYYVNGKLHRTDGPAVIDPDSYQQYWVNGKLHRIGGPAVILADGTQEYWLNDERHRTDGPAIIDLDGTQEYWLNGVPYTKKQYLKRVKEYLSRNNLTDKELDKIREISDSLFGDTLGVAQALGLFRKSLDKTEELLNDSKYEELSNLGYTKLAENFIFLQRVLGGLQNANHEKEKLIQSIALRLGKSYEEVQPLVEDKIQTCK